MTMRFDIDSQLLPIFEEAPIIMLLVDEERRVQRANRMALESMKREHDEVIGLRGGEALKCIHASDHEDGCGFGPDCQDCIVRNTVLDTFKDGKAYRRVATPLHLSEDGAVANLHVLISTNLLEVKEGKLVLICVEDITDFKQTEKELRISEERYALAQRAANIGSWDWDIVTGDLKWSDTIEPMFGFGKGEFGATYEAFLECVHPEDRNRVEDSVRASVESNADYDIEHRIIWPDGSIRWVTETGDVFRDDDGKPVRMVGIVRDITERKKVDQLKDDFIGLVSHELRSPLTVIIGAINTVLSEGDYLTPEETEELIRDASLEAESLSHLIGNLVEMSRSQAERLLLYPEPIDLTDVITQLVEKVQKYTPEHTFSLDFSEELPFVRADQLRVERIVQNLLENAAKYSPDGTEIRISVQLNEDSFVVGVRDKGEGLSAEEVDTLFHPFERLKKHTYTGITGTGLGLSVCKTLVEAHGGNIWVESEPGEGSEFLFSLPRR